MHKRQILNVSGYQVHVGRPVSSTMSLSVKEIETHYSLMTIITFRFDFKVLLLIHKALHNHVSAAASHFMSQQRLSDLPLPLF